MVIGFKDEIAGGKEYPFNFRILVDLFVHCGNDKLVVFAGSGGDFPMMWAYS